MKNKKLLLVCCLMAISSLSSCIDTPSENISSDVETPSNIESPSVGNTSTPSVDQSSTLPDETIIPSEQPSTPSEQPSTGDSSTPSEQPSTGDSSTPSEQPSTGDSSTPDVTPTYETITIEQAISLTKQLAQNTKSSEAYYIKGIVSEIWNATYGNFNFGPRDNQFTIYGTYSSDGSVKYSNMQAKVSLNDEIVFYGKLYHYYNAGSSTPTKYEVEDAWLMSINGVAVNANGTLANSQSGGSGNDDSSSSGSTTPINPGTQWTNDDFGNYYQGIDFSNNSTLLKQLQTLNGKKRTSTVGYNGMRTDFIYTDYDPKNPSSKLLDFYSQEAFNKTWDSGNTWNREHVWPNSRGGSNVEADIHVIRPTLTKNNSSRGNSFYVANMASSSGGWDPKTAGMLEESRGYAARIIFYCCVASSSLTLVDKNDDSTSNNTMGKLSDLLRWNLQYAVDITELNRNNGAEDLQGNRNPFIDNPYLACAIWGNYNDTTREICKDYGVIVDPYTGDITLPDGPQPSTPSSPSVEPSSPSVPSTPSTPSNPDNNDGGYYQRVSANQTDWSGNYLIVYEGGNVALNPTVSNINASGNTQSISIVDNKVAWTETLENISVTISQTSGGYTIKTSTGKYLGASSSKNSISLSDSAVTNTITFVSAGDITIKSSYNNVLKYNTSWPGFRYYSSGQSAITLYKYVAE